MEVISYQRLINGSLSVTALSCIGPHKGRIVLRPSRVSRSRSPQRTGLRCETETVGTINQADMLHQAVIRDTWTSEWGTLRSPTYASSTTRSLRCSDAIDKVTNFWYRWRIGKLLNTNYEAVIKFKSN